MIACIVLAALCLGIAAGCAVVVLWARAERRDERKDEGAERALHAWALVRWVEIAAREAVYGYPMYGYRGYRRPYYRYDPNIVPTLNGPLRFIVSKDGVKKML
jgi:hypothetical protein